MMPATGPAWLERRRMIEALLLIADELGLNPEGRGDSDPWPAAWIEERIRAGGQDVETPSRVREWLEESLAALGDLDCLARRDCMEGHRRLTAGDLNYAVATLLPDPVGVVLAEDRDRKQAGTGRGGLSFPNSRQTTKEPNRRLLLLVRYYIPRNL